MRHVTPRNVSLHYTSLGRFRRTFILFRCSRFRIAETIRQFRAPFRNSADDKPTDIGAKIVSNIFPTKKRNIRGRLGRRNSTNGIHFPSLLLSTSVVRPPLAPENPNERNTNLPPGFSRGKVGFLRSPNRRYLGSYLFVAPHRRRRSLRESMETTTTVVRGRWRRRA